MNTLQLIERLREETGITKLQSKAIVKLFFSQMADALASDDRVEIRGLWSFYAKEYKGYTGRNPKTGGKIKVAGKRLPFFKCGKGLKERMNGG